MDLMSLADYINKYGFPIVASSSMGYIVYSVWIWATQTARPIIHEATIVLIELIDQIRVLDNDMIRLHQKLNTIIELRNENK
mgnify:FL=1